MVKIKHHYVPVLHLAGFTEKQTKDSAFYVLDTESGMHKSLKPKSVAFQKHLYSVDIPGHEPDIVENAFAELEGEVAPIIKKIYETKVMPINDEYHLLMYYIALLFQRNPDRIELFNKAVDDISKITLDMIASSRDRYESFTAQIHEHKSLEYDDFKKKVIDGRFTFSVNNNIHVANIFKTAGYIIESLIQRKWTVLHTQPTVGDFICSDIPADLHWEKQDEGMWSSPGHSMPGTEISIPLSSRIMLIGTIEDKYPKYLEITNKRLVAQLNTYTAMNARFIFSRKRNFYWITSELKIGDTDDLIKALGL